MSENYIKKHRNKKQQLYDIKDNALQASQNTLNRSQRLGESDRMRSSSNKRIKEQW